MVGQKHRWQSRLAISIGREGAQPAEGLIWGVWCDLQVDVSTELNGKTTELLSVWKAHNLASEMKLYCSGVGDTK